MENEKDPTTLKIDDELRKIDAFVELVLYYARSSDVEKDFKVEKTTLKALVSAALKTYSKPIIQASGRIQMEGLDISVCADCKSCAFVIGQIISNAIKYRQDNFCLTFTSDTEKNRVLLKIHDNGIGIDTADLSRVFDKGFTGENGRRFPKSTGIGLYLCKKLCGKMNMDNIYQQREREWHNSNFIFSNRKFSERGGRMTRLFPTLHSGNLNVI